MKLSLLTSSLLLLLLPLLATPLCIPPPPPPPSTPHRRGCSGPGARPNGSPAPTDAAGDQSFCPPHHNHNPTISHRRWPFPRITGPGPVMDAPAVTAPVQNGTDGTEADRWRGYVVDGEREREGEDEDAGRAMRRVRRGDVFPPGERRPVRGGGVEAAPGVVDVGRVLRGKGEREEGVSEGLRGGFLEYMGQGGAV